MKTFTVLIMSLLAAASPASAESTAIVNVNVNVIPMTSETVLGARTVIVTDGEIVVIGDVDDTAVAADAVVVDGTDRFLIPGLFEMHGHVPDVNSGRLDRILHLYVANGMTTVRGMLATISP